MMVKTMVVKMFVLQGFLCHATLIILNAFRISIEKRAKVKVSINA